ncbi:hypothetical protein PMAYCL1PPCAC_09337, partial [Pristionchus mayeri]
MIKNRLRYFITLFFSQMSSRHVPLTIQSLRKAINSFSKDHDLYQHVNNGSDSPLHPLLNGLCESLGIAMEWMNERKRRQDPSIKQERKEECGIDEDDKFNVSDVGEVEVKMEEGSISDLAQHNVKSHNVEVEESVVYELGREHENNAHDNFSDNNSSGEDSSVSDTSDGETDDISIVENEMVCDNRKASNVTEKESPTKT